MTKLKWRKKDGCLMATGKLGLFYHISAIDRGGCFGTIEWCEQGNAFNPRINTQYNNQLNAKKHLESLELFLNSYSDSAVSDLKEENNDLWQKLEFEKNRE